MFSHDLDPSCCRRLWQSRITASFFCSVSFHEIKGGLVFFFFFGMFRPKGRTNIQFCNIQFGSSHVPHHQSVCFHVTPEAELIVAEITEKAELEGVTEDHGKLAEEPEKASRLVIINEALQDFVDGSAISFRYFDAMPMSLDQLDIFNVDIQINCQKSRRYRRLSSEFQF